MKHVIKGYITAYFSPYAAEPNLEPSFNFFSFKPTDPAYIVVKEVEIEVDFPIPTEAEFTALRVEALRTHKSVVFAKAAEEAAEIDQQLDKLLALENHS